MKWNNNSLLDEIPRICRTQVDDKNKQYNFSRKQTERQAIYLGGSSYPPNKKDKKQKHPYSRHIVGCTTNEK